MFYLKIWKTVLSQHPFTSTLFLVLTLSFLSLGAQYQRIGEILSFDKAKGEKSIQMNALLGKKQNAQRVARKLRELPGVKTVEVISEKKIIAETKSILGQLDVSIDPKLINLESKGLRVDFVQGTAPRSIQLIKDYLERLVGKNNITIGPIKNMKKETQSEKSGLMSYSPLFTLLFIGLIWAILNFRFHKTLGPIFYLYAKFQRSQQGLSLKLMFLSLLICLGLVLGFHFISTQSISALGLVPIIIFIFLLQGPLFFKSTKWQR